MVLHVDDGNDLDAIDRAIAAARAAGPAPTLIIVRTTIGYGAPNKQGTFAVHGAPLGADEVRAAKENLGWPAEPAFLIPDEVRGRLGQAAAAGPAAPGGLARRAWTRYAAELPGPGRRVPARTVRDAARGLGGRTARLRRRPQGHRHPQGLRGRAAGAGGARARAAGRRGRPQPVHLHLAEGRRRPGGAGPTARTTAGRRGRRLGLYRAATSTSASASTPWAPSPTAWPCTAA